MDVEEVSDVWGVDKELSERESGDGDSGAEYKDPSLPSPVMERKFEEVKGVLVSLVREVQGREKMKKPSRIPVRKDRKKDYREDDDVERLSELDEGSLSPKAPLAEEEWILEAPEEFRSDAEEVMGTDRDYGPEPEIRCGINETEHDNRPVRGNEIELYDSTDTTAANEDIATIVRAAGGETQDNYQVGIDDDPVVTGARAVSDDPAQELTLSVLKGRAAMKTLSDTTGLKIVENLRHLTKHAPTMFDAVTNYIDEDDDTKDRSLQTISDSAVQICKSTNDSTNCSTNENNPVLSPLRTDKIKNLEVIPDMPCLLKPLVPLKSRWSVEENRDVVDFSKDPLYRENRNFFEESISPKSGLNKQLLNSSFKNEDSESNETVSELQKLVLNRTKDVTENMVEAPESDNIAEESIKIENFKLEVSDFVEDNSANRNEDISASSEVTTKEDITESFVKTTLKIGSENVVESCVDSEVVGCAVGSPPGRSVACERSAVAAAAAVVASIQSADAQASKTSRVPTVKVRASLKRSTSATPVHTTGDQHAQNDTITDLTPNCDTSVDAERQISDTSAEEGTCQEKPTVFDAIVKCSERIESEITNEPLRSRDINKRPVEGTSRLKLLEEKLREAAGLSTKPKSPDKCSATDSDPKQDDPKTIILDKNDNECKGLTVERETSEDEEEDCYPQVEITELGSPADLDAFLDDRFGGRCEFDVRRIGTFTGYGGNEFFVVYDELEDEYESDDDEPTVIPKMRGEGQQSEPPKRHNPDHDNLKSLLKKPGGKANKRNRVSFNETKNEFFDADYIILIREDCDYDEDDDDGVCTCNQHEMVRLTCCEPDCNCNAYEDQTPQSPKFAPPLEFVDAVTLSPPEGYKDMDQQLLALQQMARKRGAVSIAVCKDCSGHPDSG